MVNPTLPSDRQRFIGGSEIAAVMGLSRWSTPLHVWGIKTGKIQPTDLSDNEAVQLGIELEDFVARKFSRQANLKVRVDNRSFAHDKYPYLVGHIDRRVEGGEILECKTCSAWKAKEWDGEEIPIEYIYQLMWYMGLTGSKRGYIACLIGGQKFVWKPMDFNQALYDRMVASAVDFWENYVLTDVPPMAIGGDSDTLNALYPMSEEQVVKFTGDDALLVDSLIEERDAGKRMISDANEDLEKIEVQLKQKLGAAERGETDQYWYTWKTQQRKEYTVKASTSRVFKTIKPKGEHNGLKMQAQEDGSR